MTAFDLFRFLHIVTMFFAVGVSVAPEVIANVLARRGDLAALRSFFDVVKPLNTAIPALFLLGLVFGLAAAATGGIDFLRPWLIAAYVVFAATFFVGGVIGGRYLGALAEASFANEGTEPSPAFRTAAADGRGMFSIVFGNLAIVVIVFLMVVKPGG